jgi:hypothetical protein
MSYDVRMTPCTEKQADGTWHAWLAIAGQPERSYQIHGETEALAIGRLLELVLKAQAEDDLKTDRRIADMQRAVDRLEAQRDDLLLRAEVRSRSELRRKRALLKRELADLERRIAKQ